MAKKKADAQVERIVAALTDDDSALRSQGVNLVLGFVLDQPLETWVDADEVVEIVAAALNGTNVHRHLERHVRPQWERYLARCEANGETPGDALPPGMRDRIVRLIKNTPPPKGRWTRGAVDTALVGELLSPVLQDFLVSFAKRLPIPGLGGSRTEATANAGSSSRSGFGLRSRLKESVERHAGSVVEAGRSALGGLGAEVERQIASVARDVSQSAGAELRSSLRRRLESAEGRRILGTLVEQAMDHTLATPLHALNEDTAALPWDEIWALVPPIVEHNHTREPIQEAIRSEVQAALSLEGGRTLREVLEEAGVLDQTLAQALGRADGVARELFGSEAFAGWLGALLAV